MTLVRQIGGRVLPFGSKYGGLAELAFYIPSNILGRPLDRRIGAAFSLRSKYGGRRRSSHLGYIEIYKTRSHSVRSRLEYSGSSLERPNKGPLLPFGSK